MNLLLRCLSAQIPAKVDIEVFHIKYIWSNFDDQNTDTLCSKLELKCSDI